MKLIDFLTRTFTWWNGQTWGTYWFTRRHGERVGEDEFGNVYYRCVNPYQGMPSTGPERRWVIYQGVAEMSHVPPSWRGWLAHTHDIPPSEESYTPREWELPPLPNLTGTPQAYRPPGSTLMSGRRPPATGDYVAWSPDEASNRAG